MHIAMLTNFTPSIIPFRGALLARLVGNGHDVTVLAPGNAVEGPPGLLDLGVRFRSISLDRTGLNPFADLSSGQRLKRLLMDIQPDILLNYTIKPAIYGSLAGKAAGVANIYSVITGLGYVFIGGGVVKKLLRRVVCGLYRMALPLNRAVFFLNPDDLQLFRDHRLVGDDQETVILDGEGIPLDQYTPAPLPAEPVFLFIGRMIRDKGLQEYVDAAKILKRRYPRARFRIVGFLDENPASFTAADVARWQEEKVVEYMGRADDVRPHLAAASVFVLPSYREGTPRTVLEAMAMGRPVVTTHSPGCREAVVEGENGFKVPIRDTGALAGAMARFINEPALAQAMGRRSRQLAEARYDVTRINGVILAKMGLAGEAGF